MNKIRLTVIVGFALAFAAGGSVGVLATSEARRKPGPERGPRHHPTRELGLTAEQQEQMRKIWSEMMRSEAMQQLWQRMSALRRKRVEAFEALLTDEQRQKYDQILADHDREMEHIGQERHRLVEEAVERTKKILTAEQAKKYEEIRKRWRRGPGPGGPPGSFRGGRRGGARTRPGSRGPLGMGPLGDPRHLRNSDGRREAEERATNPSQP